MCGIVGFISGAGKVGYPMDRTKFIKQGLVVDTLRGFDATGIFTVDQGAENEAAGWLKHAVEGGSFVRTKDFADMTAAASAYRTIIGHNRAATVGSVSTDNAHPFQVDHITMVHNGTLNSTYYLPVPERELKHKDVEVDSHVLAYNLAHSPIKDWYTELFGAWAIVWHDASDGSVNVVRNEQRPLHLAKVLGEDTIVLCSEADMLAFIARRVTMNIGDVYSFRAHHHYKWYPDTAAHDPVVEKLERRMYHSYADYWKGGDSSRGSAYSQDPFANKNYVKTSNQVIMCGKLQDIPELFQHHLEVHELEVEDRLTFHPWYVMGKEGSVMAVNGWLPGVDMQATVCGVPSSFASKTNSGKEKWTVRPIAINYHDCPDKDPDAHVVCRFIVGHELETNYAAEYSNIPLGMVRGPKGVYITASEFREAVKDGCALCKQPVDVLDDMDIEWNDEKQPICFACLCEDKWEGGIAV